MAERRWKTSGFGFVDAVMGAGLLAIAAYTMASFQAQQNRSLASVRALSTRDSIVTSLDRYALRSEVYEASAAYTGTNDLGNLAFKYCYQGSPSSGPACAPNCCNATTLANPQPFNLIDPVSGTTLLAGTHASTTYAGQDTTLSPARFDRFGNPCTTHGPDCPLEVVASYVAECSGSSPCPKAETISILYTVRQSSNAATNGQMAFRPYTRKVYNIARPGTGGGGGGGGAAATGPVQKVVTGKDYTCVLVHGSVQCWGQNNFGQIGRDPSLIWQSSTPLIVPGLESDVQDLTSGYNFSCAIVNGGGKCWGRGSFGTLGNDNNADSFTPVNVLGPSGSPLNNITQISLSVGHGCAISNGALYCWGSSLYGALGTDAQDPMTAPDFYGQVHWRARPVIGMGAGVTYVGTGLMHTCAIKNGAVYCWGHNENAGTPILGVNPASGYSLCYHLGYPGPSTRCIVTPILVTGSGVSGVESGATQVTSGGDSVTTCALVRGGVKCWGATDDGIIGDGDPTEYDIFPVDTLGGLDLPSEPNVQMISTAYWGTCAVVQGAMKCWGHDGISASGVLGAGIAGAVRSIPFTVPGMSSGVTHVAINRSHDHNCAVKNGEAWCWGDNTAGKLGDGTTTNSLVPVKVVGLQ